MMLYFLTCCVALHTAVNIEFLSKKWKRQFFIQNFDFSLNSFLKICNNLISKFKNKTLKNAVFSTKNERMCQCANSAYFLRNVQFIAVYIYEPSLGYCVNILLLG